MCDFGDSYMNHLELVEISTHPINEVLPQINRGENACPPEGCGGNQGYKKLKRDSDESQTLGEQEPKRMIRSGFNQMACDMKTIQQNFGCLGN